MMACVIQTIVKCTLCHSAGPDFIKPLGHIDWMLFFTRNLISMTLARTVHATFLLVKPMFWPYFM